MQIALSSKWTKKITSQPGGSTYFIEKLMAGLNTTDFTNIQFYADSWKLDYIRATNYRTNGKGKIHVIVPSTKVVGAISDPVHLFMDKGSRNPFEFAPVLSIVSIQTITITYDQGIATIVVGTTTLNSSGVDTLAINEGFDSTADFLEYYAEDFTGKVIHFTALNY